MVNIPPKWQSLSDTQRDALTVIAYEPEVSNKEVSTRLTSSEMTVSRACRVLRDRGLITSTRGPDGAYRNRATDEGEQLVEKVIRPSLGGDDGA